MVEGDLAKPSVVIFHSTYPNATPELKMKVFALGRIPRDQRGKMESELNDLLEEQSAVTHQAQAHAASHSDTSLLIVFGPESALEAAESFVAAWRDNHPDPGPTPPPQPAQK
jgi:hypothetical protein